jgi:hypothetical protein
MFSYEFKDEAKCKAIYANEIKYVSFNEFLSKTTSPKYLNVGNGKWFTFLQIHTNLIIDLT